MGRIAAVLFCRPNAEAGCLPTTPQRKAIDTTSGVVALIRMNNDLGAASSFSNAICEHQSEP